MIHCTPTRCAWYAANHIRGGFKIPSNTESQRCRPDQNARLLPCVRQYRPFASVAGKRLARGHDLRTRNHFWVLFEPGAQKPCPHFPTDQSRVAGYRCCAAAGDPAAAPRAPSVSHPALCRHPRPHMHMETFGLRCVTAGQSPEMADRVFLPAPLDPVPAM